MNLCLFSLALVIMLYVTFFRLAGSYCLVRQLVPKVEQWWKFIVRACFIGFYGGFFSSGCLTTLITVERCVRHPASENCDTGELGTNGRGDHRRCGGVASRCVLAVPSRDHHLDQGRSKR